MINCVCSCFPVGNTSIWILLFHALKCWITKRSVHQNFPPACWNWRLLGTTPSLLIPEIWNGSRNVHFNQTFHLISDGLNPWRNMADTAPAYIFKMCYVFVFATCWVFQIYKTYIGNQNLYHRHKFKSRKMCVCVWGCARALTRTQWLV